MNSKFTRFIPRWFACLLVASVAIVGYGTLSMKPTTRVNSPKVSPQNAALYDTVWIDHYPEMTSDPWKAYIFTSDNVGLSVDAKSSYKLTLELFEFKVEKNAIVFHFPHDGRRARCLFTIEKLKKPTPHFDTKLTIENDPQNNGQTKVYYTGPEFHSASTLPPFVKQAVSGFWH